MAKTVLLVDDHELIRQGLRRAFERDGEFSVVAEAGSIAEALSLAAEHSPGIVVVDLRLPDGNGLDATRKLREMLPSAGIVVLTMYSGDDQLFGALEAGASAFVSKDAPADDVVAAAKHASAAPNSFTAVDLADAMRRKMSPTSPQLTAREREVLDLLADGLPVAGIAKKLYISESTAKTHISKVYEKLGAGNRAQALMTALKLGLISAGDNRP